VVIDNFHIFGACFTPAETNTPPIIDTNAVLPGSVAHQYFKAIARWYTQVIESGNDFQLPQFPPRYRGDVHEVVNANAFCKRLRIRTFERLDQGPW
jgi:hypothetical protein